MTNTLTATLRTNQGTIVVRLFPDQAPKTVRNFVELAEGTRDWTDPRTGQPSRESLYNGTIFHRVIPDFMIQGGGFTQDMQQKKTNAPVKNEADNVFLDHGKRDFGYAVFGKVSKGTEVVDKIAGVKTGRSGGHGDVPVSPVLINKMKRG